MDHNELKKLMISAIMESHHPKMIAGKRFATKKNINDKEPYTHGYKIIRKVVGCATVFCYFQSRDHDWNNTSKDRNSIRWIQKTKPPNINLIIDILAELKLKKQIVIVKTLYS